MAYEADTAPLRFALSQIKGIAARDRGFATELLELLNEIGDVIEIGRAAFRENVMAAQKAEIADLRARKGY